jgi:glycosyltransferase involved in cell wall biosynthesis
VKFSLVVPTIGRPADLQRFIDTVHLQAGPGLELREIEMLVVDQSRQPETGELLARQQTEFRIRHLPMNGRGVSNARNYGWSFAQGEIITFPDDDCHYSPGFLPRILERLRDPEVDAIEVCVEHFNKPNLQPGRITRENLFDRCVEAGLFARRERFGDVRFDERMGIGCETPWNSDEGPDMLLRLLARGIRIEFHPDLCVHHPDPRQQLDERLQERNFKYSRGRGYLLAKHRFPFTYVARLMLRSLGASVLMAASLKPFWARYYWRSFVGRMQGLRGGKNAPEQLLTSPLRQPVAEQEPARA